jgi:putative cell wall-binding protein
MGVNGYVGGYIGYATGGVTINKCNNGANVTGFRAGGFVGESSGNISMTRCYNSGKVSASYTNPTSTSDIPMAGGIIGCVSGGNYNVTYSYNIKAISANVSGLECEAGGIVGDLAGTYDLSDLGLVNNTGSITSNSIAGGVFGRLSNTQDQNILTYAFNTGGVSGTDYAGGIVGVWNDSTDGASMMSCYSIGTVTGGTTGALVGKVANSNDSGLVDLFASACYYGEKSADKIVGECNEYTRSIGENEMVSMDYVTSGRLTRMLNILNNGTGEYGQNLDNGKFKDSYPVLIGNYDEGIHDSVYEVTVTACDGSTSTVYTNTESYVTENVTHQIGYTAKNNVLTATCSVCKNTGTATLGFASSVDSSDINYTGSDIEPMEVSYDDGWSNLGLSSDLNITYSNNTNAGTATAKIASGGATASRNFTIKGTASSDKSFKRYYGSSRYDTSLAAAGAVKENLGVDKFDNVIITSGENFADALSGAYLAKLRNAPILGVNSATESRIQTYIDENLKADGTVYILGGTGAVSKKLENALAKDGFTIKRLGGANRYETNLEILKECEVNGADILVCSGTGYADSLSASASGRPIMLVANGFSKDQQAYLDGISTGTMYIIGGTGAVNAATAKAAANYGTTKRLGGATRYDTSVLVAEEFFTGNCDNLVLAYGQNFPDGLSGGPLALTLDAPLILTQNNSTVSQKAADFAAKKNVKFIAVLGGTALISDGTVQKILN